MQKVSIGQIVAILALDHFTYWDSDDIKSHKSCLHYIGQLVADYEEYYVIKIESKIFYKFETQSDAKYGLAYIVKSAIKELKVLS